MIAGKKRNMQHRSKATVNNAGPGLNEIGPAGNFSGLTALQLNICSAAMILGRLEMMSILAIFTVEFWRE
jgi:trk system potassium uptake protein TrkH